MTTLIITLPPDAADATAPCDYVLSPDGSSVGEQSRAPLALLPRLKDAEVVAVVAPRHLSWHQVTLPRGTLGRSLFQDRGTARVRTVLEGLLEDRLLDDTAQLHFALEPAPRADAPVWVAVCDRAWLRSALHALEQAQLPVSRIVPEFAPDLSPEVLHVVGEPDDAHLVFATPGGVAVWPLSAASVALLNGSQDKRLVAEPAVAALAEQLFRRSVDLQQGAERRVRASQSPWDLAQFDLVNSGHTRAWKGAATLLSSFTRAPRWRPARLALLALVLVNLAGLNAWAWHEQAALKAKRTAIREVLTRTFPGVQVVVDAPLQMAREVAALQQASGTLSGRDLETMMGLVGAAAPPDIIPRAIEFAAAELRLRGLTLPPDAMAQFSFKLQAQGYETVAEGDSLVIRPGRTP